MMEYLKWQIIIIIYLFTSVFIIFFEKYEYNVLDNHSLQSFGKGRIVFLSDRILYNVVEVGENERYFYGKNIILNSKIDKEEYFVFDKKEKKSNIYFSKEEIENIVGNIHLENIYFFLMKKTSKEYYWLKSGVVMKYNMKEIFETAIILFILRNILILINIIFSIKNIEILFFFLIINPRLFYLGKRKSK